MPALSFIRVTDLDGNQIRMRVDSVLEYWPRRHGGAEGSRIYCVGIKPKPGAKDEYEQIHTHLDVRETPSQLDLLIANATE